MSPSKVTINLATSNHLLNTDIIGQFVSNKIEYLIKDYVYNIIDTHMVCYALNI